MAKNLLIVESPAKAKTIEKILGSDFEVKSCYGHIRDLEKEDMGIDIKNGYQPKYVVSEDKGRVVNELKSLAKKADEVWLATDEDREGESISWHLCEVLGLNPVTTKRIVFHEITKPAILKAVQNPRTVNMDLVNAQQARRVLDRIVGFELSPVLWRKMSMRNNLSAGRVQSVAVRLIVEREREINHFQAQSSFKLEAFFQADDLNKKKVVFKAEGPERMKDATTARAYLDKCIGASYTVKDIQVKPAKKSPAAPFTTSTLQQEASRKLGYSVSRTMSLAQKLYENGHITYMRTDSVNLSETALEGARASIISHYGEKYHQQRRFQNKNESAQEAHEAIRPTDMMITTISDPDLHRLYELIWKRTMASQMADAQLERTIAKINVSTQPDPLTATGEVLRFDGFLKVYTEGRDDEDGEEENEGMLPPLAVGQGLDLQEMRATERYTRPQPRYTEASLVKKLEELGIGRPSTYASTISTIQQRGYVERKDKEGIKRDYQILSLKNENITERKETENTGAEKAKLFPSDLGMVVTDFLADHFERVMDYSFTAKIEQEFDEIAGGKKKWNTVIDDFYHPFHELVAHTMETAGRVKGERVLGTDPESGKPVVARLGRFGPMIQIGSTEDEEKPRFATLKSSQSIETITFEEALDLFKLPFSLGAYQEKEVVIGAGRFGPYVKWGEAFISIPRGEDPIGVDMNRAIELIEEKQRADAPVGHYSGKPVTKGKGRFGPFIKWEDLYINVPRAYNFDALTQKDIDELISKKVEKEANRYIKQWTEEKIAIENGRWGPFIRFGKNMLKLDKKEDNSKYTAEELSDISLDDVKKMITQQMPDAFEKKEKKTATKKAAGAKKAPAKKAAAPKKAAPKKK
ncbi:type I DNA topoisomerase [Taibaiella soli]|uniref:DNA topoisomerase 1 n=1 Tax=Taibaiella soli TaxID=1649169 RepID=A0A2W2BX61_9BACT|nr:type I DNA topoisomerase [Taibaiella soli]PZF72443.1 type I DNA topoisomerase [Taibaiella soli]